MQGPGKPWGQIQKVWEATQSSRVSNTAMAGKDQISIYGLCPQSRPDSVCSDVISVCDRLSSWAWVAGLQDPVEVWLPGEAQRSICGLNSVSGPSQSAGN